MGFRHQSLERFFRTGKTGGIDPQHAPKLSRQLSQLDASSEPRGMDVPGWRLHPLQGSRKGEWAVWVSGNWRLTFTFVENDATAVGYEDYH